MERQDYEDGYEDAMSVTSQSYEDGYEDAMTEVRSVILAHMASLAKLFEQYKSRPSANHILDNIIEEYSIHSTLIHTLWPDTWRVEPISSLHLPKGMSLDQIANVIITERD